MEGKEWRKLGKVVGKSAYDSAVEQGFIGTEEEWVRYVEANGQEAKREADRAKREADRAKREADGVFGDVSNAIKDELSGSIVTTDKVSSLRHPVECKVENINLASTVWSEYKHGTYSVKNLNLSPGKWTVKAELVGTAVTDSIFAFKRDNNDYPFVGMANAINLDGSTKSYTFDLSSADIPNPGIAFYGNEAKFNEVIANYHITVSKSAEYTPYIPDLSKVTVTRCGTNILPDKLYMKASYNAGILPASSGGPGPFIMRKGVKYILQSNKKASGLYIGRYTGGMDYAKAYNNTKLEYIPDEDKLVYAYCFFSEGTENTIVWINSESAKPYEPYNGIDYTPLPDGFIMGMDSLYPIMTILTGTPGVTIDAIYNQDTMKVIQKLTDRIAALEGKATNI